MMDSETLVVGRDRLLATARRDFAGQAGVVGVYLGGSLPAGTADVYSDIDLRVVVEADVHRDFVERRLDIPRSWDGFLFNEWLEGANHCVSHFRPFVKIDIFYLDRSALAPSPWFTLPISVLHDPQGVVADVLVRSRGLTFAPIDSDIDRSISKGIAAVHESYRRIRRGELIHSQALLDELRYHMVLADDWINDRAPRGVAVARYELRASPAILSAVAASYVPLDVNDLDRALRVLAVCYRAQVLTLHERFRLERPRDHDIEAIDVVLQAKDRGRR
jgi:hypothetical protein